jgi:hypothetical protein
MITMNRKTLIHIRHNLNGNMKSILLIYCGIVYLELN